MSTVLLAFDTATEVTTVGLARMSEGRLDLIASAVEETPRAAMSRLLPMTESLLGANGLTAAQLDGVIVGRGPGSFTGVRIGVATAKGLAHGLSCPLWGVGTLDAIAWGFSDEEIMLGVLGDAMRGEVYPALFRCGGGCVERLTPHRVGKPGDIAAEWQALDTPLVLAGNGLRKYGELFDRALGDRATHSDAARWAPYGRGLFEAWMDSLAREPHRSAEPGDLLPVYTRLSDAEENEQAKIDASSALPDSGVAGRERS